MLELIQLFEALGPVFLQNPVVGGAFVVLVLLSMIFSSILTTLVVFVKMAAAQPKESADTLRLRAEAAKSEAEAAKYQAEAERIAAKSDRDTISALAAQVDRLTVQNDRLERENLILGGKRDELIEALAVCQSTCTVLERRANRMDERLRLMAEWIEHRGGSVTEIAGGAA